MELHYLHEFCILAETKNFLEAADRLELAQSTLSRHIQTLETELGSPLFIRTTRRIKLSKYGNILLPYAQEMMAIENRIHADFIQKRKNTRNVLSIGSIPLIAQYGISTLLVQFQKDNPLSTFEITEGESWVLKEKIRRGELDFAFVREFDLNTNSHEFVIIPYLWDQISAILPINHLLATAASLSLAQLRKENFLLLPKDTLMYQLCVNACIAKGNGRKMGRAEEKTGHVYVEIPERSANPV